MSLADGYYAVPDPDDPGIVTCWRWSAGKGLRRWSGGAAYGEPSQASRGNPPRPITLAVRILWRAWFQEVLAGIQADPTAARDRFAAITECCYACSKKLREPQSVALGIGPDCRRERAA